MFTCIASPITLAHTQEEDESGGEAANPTAKKPKLDAVIPNKPLSAEEKKKAIKQLIGECLFRYDGQSFFRLFLWTM